MLIECNRVVQRSTSGHYAAPKTIPRASRSLYVITIRAPLTKS